LRADNNTRAMATERLLKIVDALALHFKGMQPDAAKRKALVALSTMVGALTLSRMMTQTELSDLLLQDAAEHVSIGQQ
jgi:TetR/AcrR family transcriptional regulator, transcriptional repressor for nem operon